MHLTECPSDSTHRVLRGILVALLVALWTCASVVLNPMGTLVADDEKNIAKVGPYLWFGAMSALPCLFAVWAALTTQAWPMRVPLVAGVAALMGLMVTWGQIRNTQSRDVDMNSVLLLLSVTCLHALCLVPLYRRFGWHVVAEEMVPQRSSAEYWLGWLLAWATAVAVFCGLASRIIPDWAKVSESLRSNAWLAATIEVVVFVVLTLPLVIPSVALILGDGRRMWHGMWFAVASGLWAIALYALEVENGRRGGAVGADVLIDSLAVVAILLGFLFALLGSLLVARMCGFRLMRGGNLCSALPA